MTYKRHPMNKRINAPRRPRRRMSLTAALRAASRALGIYADALSTAMAGVARSLASASRALRSLPPHRSEYTLAN